MGLRLKNTLPSTNPVDEQSESSPHQENEWNAQKQSEDFDNRTSWTDAGDTSESRVGGSLSRPILEEF